MIPQQALPQELENKIRSELEPGERIVWSQQPVPRYFSPGAAGAFLFAIPWTAFSVFWMYGASGFKMPDFSKGFPSLFPLFGLPFFLIGLAMLSSPLMAYRKAFKTVYIITDRRAISIESGWRSTTFRSFAPNQLQHIYREEKQNGTGNVIFDQSVWKDPDGDKRSRNLGFLNVREPKAVELLLKRLAGNTPAGYTP